MPSGPVSLVLALSITLQVGHLSTGGWTGAQAAGLRGLVQGPGGLSLVVESLCTDLGAWRPLSAPANTYL